MPVVWFGIIRLTNQLEMIRIVMGGRHSQVDARMLNSIGKHTGDLSVLLGGWDLRTNPHREKWHPIVVAVEVAIQFVNETGRFEEETREGS